jgi:hypothetical protein
MAEHHAYHARYEDGPEPVLQAACLALAVMSKLQRTGPSIGFTGGPLQCSAHQFGCGATCAM